MLEPHPRRPAIAICACAARTDACEMRTRLMTTERWRSAAGRLCSALPLVILLGGLATPPTAAGAGQGAVSSGADRISMDVWKQPLREVAEQLAQQGSVDILIPHAVRIALLDPEDAVRARALELIEEWHLDAGATGAR